MMVVVAVMRFKSFEVVEEMLKDDVGGCGAVGSLNYVSVLSRVLWGERDAKGQIWYFVNVNYWHCQVDLTVN